MTLTSQQRAILFADLTGSTGLYETLGDQPAARAIAHCLTPLQEIVQVWKGRVVKTIGDEIMAEFPSAECACDAAKSMQLRVTAMPPVSGVKLAIRIGFHFGPVLEDKGDFWGDGVNIAARLAGLAKASHVYTSAATAQALPLRLRSSLRDLSTLAVKGKQDDLQVFELMWEESDDATTLARVSSSAQVEAALHLQIGGRVFDYPRDKNMLTLGRDVSCDVVAKEKTASRRHARIERHGVQYFLVDESTNGTYLQIEGDREVRLRREQAMLRGRGRISFGVSVDAAMDSLHFECE